MQELQGIRLMFLPVFLTIQMSFFIITYLLN